jgi:lipopolysaccharide export system permease protein
LTWGQVRLFLYILRDYLKYVAGALVLSLFLFILFDFIHRTTRYFPRYKPSAELILKMYAFQIPSQLLQALPIASLLASVVCMVLLGRTNELTAMRSVGIGPVRLAQPLLCGGAILAVAGWFLNEVIVPVSADRLHYVQEVQIEGVPSFEIAQGVSWVSQGDTIYDFGFYDTESQGFKKIRISRLYENFSPKQSIEAQTAKSLGTGQQWELRNVTTSDFNRDGAIVRQYRQPEVILDLPVDVSKLRKERRLPSEMSRRELGALIKSSENSGRDILPLKVDYHLKLAFPFAALVVSLLGLKFMYSSERTAETARSILAAFGIGMSYWFLLNAFLAFGRRGNLSPWASAWAANAILLVVVVTDAWRARSISR